jgi:hypothetical protein
VTGRVDQVEDVSLPPETHVLRFDRDAALALEVHRVEVLRPHVARSPPGELEHPIGERGLAVIDVGDDGQIAEFVDRHGPIVVDG